MTKMLEMTRYLGNQGLSSEAQWVKIRQFCAARKLRRADKVD